MADALAEAYNIIDTVQQANGRHIYTCVVEFLNRFPNTPAGVPSMNPLPVDDEVRLLCWQMALMSVTPNPN